MCSYMSIAMSSDGDTVAVAGFSGQVYLSVKHGSTRAVQSLSYSSVFYNGVAMSSTGQPILVGKFLQHTVLYPGS